MLWQRSATRAVGSDEAPPDLRSLAGLPGRLSFAEGFGGSRMAHIPCTVRRVDQSDIVLELTGAVAVPPADSAVILEVTNQRALIQCFTSVGRPARVNELVLRTPSRTHVVQRRRFPRIDVFQGVTLHTADRPIEPLAAQMINLSMEGAACVVTEALEPGARVTLNLTTLGFHPACVQAEVRRCMPTPSHLWVVGLQFLSLVPEQELYLGKYIADFAEAPNEA